MVDPRDPRVTHGLIPLMAMLRKKRFLEEQRRREAAEVPLPEGAEDEPIPTKKRRWIW
jgi:hypothetical protein